MQTFLPYPDFLQSAKCLDNKRLGKQRVKAKQIYLALTQPGYGWKNHPAVKMWQNHHWTLACYGLLICVEWKSRGFNDTLWDWFYAECSWCRNTFQNPSDPSWLGNSSFHASHRSNLLRKDPVWYGRFGWTEGPDLPYVWPTKVGLETASVTTSVKEVVS